MSSDPPDGLYSVAAPAPETSHFAIRGPIERDDLPGLCSRVCRVLEQSAARIVLCDVRGVETDAVTVDALARLQLAARRRGCRVRLCNASDELLELVAFMGLTDVLPCDGAT
jgi:ABC-type transporter Mla MlaB component